MRVPTVAAVAGYCLGGGLAIAAACDIRVASPDASFGVPIARTIGNCLSISTIAALIEQFGAARMKDMLLRSRMQSAEDALTAGFVSELVPWADLLECAETIANELAENAPLTMWATKEAVRRIRLAGLPTDDDIVRTVYGSKDFQKGVRDFLEKRPHDWTGR